MTGTVLILGPSGKIGTHAKRAFGAAGWQVRSYDRATNDMISAAQGVDVIINGLNPPNYHNWARLIPQITKEVIAAAKAVGATVIIPGNVYNFGDVPGTWSEHTPQNANTRKGRIRIVMEEAYRRSGVQTIVLRAGNFIDPDQNGDVMSMLQLSKIGKGKLVTMGDPRAMQPYCYLPDWARAAVALADKRLDLQSFEDIPFPGHAFTMENLRQFLETQLDKKIRIRPFPWWTMTLAAPFWELARELAEMRYLSNTSHQLDRTKFDRLLPGFQATDLSTVMLAGLPGNIHPDQTMPGFRQIPSI